MATTMGSGSSSKKGAQEKQQDTMPIAPAEATEKVTQDDGPTVTATESTNEAGGEDETETSDGVPLEEVIEPSSDQAAASEVGDGVPPRDDTLKVLLGTENEEDAPSTANEGAETNEPDEGVQNANDEPASSASESFDLPIDVLEDMIVDESVDADSALGELKDLVSSHAVGIASLFDSARGEDSVISKEKWRDWATSLECDVDGDVADNEYNAVCGYPEDEGGDGQVAMEISRFAAGLCRIAHLYVIQNCGNPMDSDVVAQWKKFWDDKGAPRVS